MLCLVLTAAHAQTADSVGGKVLQFPGKLLGRMRRRATGVEARLTRQTERYLKKMESYEIRLQQSAGTEQLFAGSGERYHELERLMKQDTGLRGRSYSGVYPAYLDSMQGLVGFLKQHPELVQGGTGNVNAAAAAMQGLEARMNDAGMVKAYLQERKQLIGQYLAQHGMTGGVAGGLTGGPAAGLYAGMNKEVYYYGQQLRQYQEMWTSPDALESKVLALAGRLPAFQTFMKDNSMLGGLFHVPGGYGGSVVPGGLQTKEQVAQLIQGKVGGGAMAAGGGGEGSGGAGVAALQGSIQSAESQLDTYKSKLSSLGAGNGDMDMPNFKPNDQKTKTLWNRLEYGTDFQTTHDSYYFPMVTDLGLSLGYRLGHGNVVGIGASYKLGWGNGIQHIAFSSQGVGLRSFLQVRIKGGFSAAGGFEYNYTTPFANYQQLKQLQYWTKSGLVGVTKTVSMKNRFFKKTSVSLLWDFLSYQAVPQTEPFLFRIGYSW